MLRIFHGAPFDVTRLRLSAELQPFRPTVKAARIEPTFSTEGTCTTGTSALRLVARRLLPYPYP